MFDRIWTIKNPPAISSGGGSCFLSELDVSQLTRRPPPEDTRIRVDVMLIEVIRLALAFREIAFMVVFEPDLSCAVRGPVSGPVVPV